MEEAKKKFQEKLTPPINKKKEQKLINLKQEVDPVSINKKWKWSCE